MFVGSIAVSIKASTFTAWNGAVVVMDRRLVCLAFHQIVRAGL